jgi:FMN phosphatase YigB (HAD superfamily)
MIKGVVFDFGNVLCSVDRLEMCASLAKHSKLTPEEVLARVWGGDLEREAETGKIDSLELFRRVRERIKGDAAWTYEEFRSEFCTGIRPIREGFEALEFANRLGLRIFILSNTSYLHSTLLFGFEELATIPEFHVYSYKVGVMKPDPGIWQALLRWSSLLAEECVYVDDIPHYCEVARSLGFKAVNFRSGQTNLRKELMDTFGESFIL